jgi:hypothetical protein
LNFTTFWREENAVLVSTIPVDLKSDSAKEPPEAAVLKARFFPHPDLSMTVPVTNSLKS